MLSMKKKRPELDGVQTAHAAFQQFLAKADPQEKDKNPAAVALGRLGGKKGGPARKAKLSPERLRAISVNAANTRWQKATTRTEK